MDQFIGNVFINTNTIAKKNESMSLLGLEADEDMNLATILRSAIVVVFVSGGGVPGAGVVVATTPVPWESSKIAGGGVISGDAKITSMTLVVFRAFQLLATAVATI